jgi:hypothetical protein
MELNCQFHALVMCSEENLLEIETNFRSKTKIELGQVGLQVTM